MQVARYIAVGVLSLALFVGLSSTLSLIGVPNALSSGASFLIVGTVNFSLHRFYTFQSSKLVSNSLALYVLLLGVNTLMASAFVHVSVDYFGLPVLIANLACAFVLAAITYLGLKTVVM